MRRIMSIGAVSAGILVSVWATTLQKLSTDEMIRQSTGIVRAKVTGSSAAYRGLDIYTYYQLQVVETLKAGAPQNLTVAIPGGAARGIRQMVPGAPVLTTGQEYVIFLWTSRSGLTQVIGLSQGLFGETTDASGNTILVRTASTGLMLNAAGQPVADQPVAMSLAALKAEIASVLGAGK